MSTRNLEQMRRIAQAAAAGQEDGRAEAERIFSNYELFGAMLDQNFPQEFIENADTPTLDAIVKAWTEAYAQAIAERIKYYGADFIGGG